MIALVAQFYQDIARHFFEQRFVLGGELLSPTSDLATAKGQPTE
jgi:hypothetical protein